MTRDDLKDLRNHLNDKRVVLLANTTWSFIGRKPAEEGAAVEAAPAEAAPVAAVEAETPV